MRKQRPVVAHTDAAVAVVAVEESTLLWLTLQLWYRLDSAKSKRREEVSYCCY